MCISFGIDRSVARWMLTSPRHNNEHNEFRLHQFQYLKERFLFLDFSNVNLPQNQQHNRGFEAVSVCQSIIYQIQNRLATLMKN